MSELSIREKIIQAIYANLDNWLTEREFNQNCGVNKFRAKHRHEIDVAPFTVLWPLPETGKQFYRQNENSMQIRLEGIAVFGSDNCSLISEQILADMKEIMGGKLGDITDGYADSVNYMAGGTDEYPDNTGVVVGAYSQWEIKYMEKIGNPYKQDKET